MTVTGTQEQLNQAANHIDPLLTACPACGGQLRMEYKVEWRSLLDTANVYSVTPAEVIASGASIDAFGRVKCGVPYVTCMACGGHFDATDRPANV